MINTVFRRAASQGKSRVALAPNSAMAAVYAAYFLAAGIFIPFFPVFLDNSGLSATEVGLIMGVPLLVRILTGMALGAFADLIGDRALTLVVYSAIAAVSAIAFSLFDGAIALLLVMVVFAAFWTAIIPVSDAVAIDVTEATRSDFARVRAAGSVAFVVASIVGGWLIGLWGAASVPGLVAAGLVATVLASFILRVVLSTVLPALIGFGPTGGKQDTALLPVLSRPAYVMGALAGGLIQGAHAILYTRGSLHWQELGFSGDAIGLLWAVGVVAEVLLFFVAKHYLTGLDPRWLIAIGGVASVVRYILFPYVDDLALSFLLQITHGLTFGATFLGTIGWLTQHTPRKWMASGQSAAATFIAITMAILTFLSGPMFEAFGIFSMWLAALVSLVALFALLLTGGLTPLDAQTRVDPAGPFAANEPVR